MNKRKFAEIHVYLSGSCSDEAFREWYEAMKRAVYAVPIPPPGDGCACNISLHPPYTSQEDL